jgi:hypothetical protein
MCVERAAMGLKLMPLALPSTVRLVGGKIRKTHREDTTMLNRRQLREGTFEFLDNYKGARTGRQRLFPIASVLAGKRTPARA